MNTATIAMTDTLIADAEVQEMRVLSEEETLDVSGGNPVAAAVAITALMVISFSAGFAVGKRIWP